MMHAQTLAAIRPPIRKNTLAAAAAVVMFVALPSANAAANEGPSMKASESFAAVQTVSLSQPTLQVTNARGANWATSPLLPSPGTTAVQSQAQVPFWLRPLINILRRFNKWDECLNALRRGRDFFKSWYDRLPRPVKWALRAARVSSDAYVVYQVLQDAGVFGSPEPAPETASPTVATA